MYNIRHAISYVTPGMFASHLRHCYTGVSILPCHRIHTIWAWGATSIDLLHCTSAPSRPVTLNARPACCAAESRRRDRKNHGRYPALKPPLYRPATIPLLLPATTRATPFTPSTFRREEEPSSEFARRDAKRFPLRPALGGPPLTARSPSPAASGKGEDPPPPPLTPVLLPTSAADKGTEVSDNGSSWIAREL